MLTELTLQNFRGFQDLRLEGLQRVNLVVGRNNSGKTSLLEAIAFVTMPQSVNHLPNLLRSVAASGDTDRRYFRWLIRDGNEVSEAIVQAIKNGGPITVAIRSVEKLGCDVPSGSKPFHNSNKLLIHAPRGQAAVACRVVPVQHHSPEHLVKVFAAAVKRKGGEERIERLLREVDPRILKVRVEPSDDGNHVMVDLGLSEMLPVSQVGQGIYRLIAIFSELIGEKPDVCIIDEIENGIHHSMLEQVWTGIAAAAENLDVQVFATTHSQECIEAAHAAFSKRKQYDLGIVQLFRVEGAVQGRVLDQKLIEAALAGNIDLR